MKAVLEREGHISVTGEINDFLSGQLFQVPASDLKMEKIHSVLLLEKVSYHLLVRITGGQISVH